MTKKIVQTEFLIDDLKAEKMAKKLSADFNNHKGVFKTYSTPGYTLPGKMTQGSVEHALFLTYIVSIDYMTDSTQLWKQSRGAYTLFPEKFSAQNILKAKPQTTESFLKNLGARQPSIAAKTWTKISKLLIDKYQGDPRNITKEPASILEIKKRLRLFPYLKGDKLSNFYIRVMGETGMLKIKNLKQLDIPVDKQVARFTICSGALKLVSKHFVGCVTEEPLKELVEETWRIGVKNLKIAPWSLYEPISILESKICDGKKCKLCSVLDQCENVKGIVFKDNTLFLRKTR